LIYLFSTTKLFFFTKYLIMKFALACNVLALTASLSAAFVPQKAFARSTSLNSATESAVYTFAKSEEIFKEAKEVSSCWWWRWWWEMIPTSV